jgi:hypothetical protein
MNSHSPAVEAVNEEDRVLPCIERLQRLENVFEELSCKPAEIPLEKEQMLVESLDRIKSVEADLEQTKRVCFVPCDLSCESEVLIVLMVIYFAFMLPFVKDNHQRIQSLSTQDNHQPAQQKQNLSIPTTQDHNKS